ncbi:MAG: 4-hydroxy-3-methylbut-2-enyl diphosphate reductase [Patescibacteria group bacterium]|nr:4-hydroxy-3-methylbut-2-enyl diphosphate reductase [Patescibacteria group bacterium]
MSKEIIQRRELLPPLSVSEVLVAGNRGTCGGVNMTLQAVSQVLEVVDGREPVFTNWDVVHNKPIVKRFEQQGLINIQNDWEQIPDNSILILSAHGVPPLAYEIAKQKNLHVIDTTCPLVTRVHNLAKRAEEEGKHVIYQGKKGHPETIGVMGEVNEENISLIEDPKDAESLTLPETQEKIVFSQTTLGTDEIIDSQEILRRRFPDIIIPNRWDICYATDNRQQAVDDMLDKHFIDFLLVVGSSHSHNSQELKKKADKKDIPSVLIDEPSQIRRVWFTEKVKKVGVTSGASVIEEYTEDVLNWFRNEGLEPTYLDQVVDEKSITFKLPQREIDALSKRWSN